MTYFAGAAYARFKLNTCRVCQDKTTNVHRICSACWRSVPNPLRDRAMKGYFKEAGTPEHGHWLTALQRLGLG